jgi:hypothetical protein
MEHVARRWPAYKKVEGLELIVESKQPCALARVADLILVRSHEAFVTVCLFVPVDLAFADQEFYTAADRIIWFHAKS